MKGFILENYGDPFGSSGEIEKLMAKIIFSGFSCSINKQHSTEVTWIKFYNSALQCDVVQSCS